MPIKTLLGLFALGLSFGAGPCLATCGPILVSYVAGTRKNIPAGIRDYLIFSSCRIFVYVILGLLIYSLGRLAVTAFMASYSRYIFILGGVFIVSIGIFIATNKKIWFKNKNLVIMGVTIGLLPCAPMIAVLSYIGLVSKSWLQSLFFSFSFGLGTLISPLILIVVIAGFIPKILEKTQALYSKVFGIICGAVIIFLGARLMIRGF